LVFTIVHIIVNLDSNTCIVIKSKGITAIIVLISRVSNGAAGIQVIAGARAVLQCGKGGIFVVIGPSLGLNTIVWCGITL
jgi:hypothetical protein